ncbi:chaoptin-like [Vanessa atalanta]|uniref:chaoptin-like n=1 Tax=Vanessa atalanta TaxID=42275 RepID=UPI001FCD2A82|nr:chaoptin-like [Vanessa atalanta]
MRWAWRRRESYRCGRSVTRGAVGPVLTAALLVLLPRPTSAPAVSPRPCAANPLCICRADHFACDYVPFHRFPNTEAGVLHVAVSAARLGALAEAALDARSLRTLVLVASRLHHIETTALASMASSLASLDLGYNEFTEIPIEALRHLKVLNWLNLQNNYISDLDPKIDWGGLSESLTSLSLSNNHICVIHEDALSSLRHLVQLELDGNRLRQLDSGALPPSLALLRLSDNLLSDLPCGALMLLPRLRHLHLRNNILQPMSNTSCRSERSKIDSLDLSNNELTDGFYFEFYHNLQLKQLILDLNDFTTMPSLVLDCGRLEKLSISYNNLQHISESTLHALKHTLERLELDHNELTTLPDSMRELGRLRYLSLAYNMLEQVRVLPPNLHTLSLAGNFITSFPVSLKDLNPGTLTYLDLGYNRISYIVIDSFGAWSEGLTTLSLRGNRLAQLALGSFPPLPLRELVLSFNDLYYVEAGVFSNLTYLRILELSSALFSGEISTRSSLGALTWLGLDNNNIHFISSDDMLNFPSLEYLNLDFNKIIEFPSEVTKNNGTYKLKELRLSYNYISRIHSEFLEILIELQSVDLSYNRMNNISERSFYNLRNLVYLSLTGNVIELIADEAFADLPKIEVLDLQENNLVEFSTKYFANVSNKDTDFAVNVSYNKITSLVGGRLASINVLDVSHNLIETISREFFNSLGDQIRQVFLSYNRITLLDNSAFGSLPNLNILNLQENDISIIKRRAFSDMPSLQILDLSQNRIGQLSVEQFHSLHRLKLLRLDKNKLRALPRDVFKNTVLEYLDLSNNQLALFPSSALTQVGFTLRRLELSRNRIEYLDAAMFHATAFLHEMGLSHNALTVLSDNTLAGLPRLRRLDLSFNSIKTNFKELFHNAPRLRRLSLANTGLKGTPHLPLANLTELNLSGNYITSYSENDVRHLSNLRALDIAGNKFTSLRPAMWASLPQLISLDVSQNPIVRIQRGLFDGLSRLLYLRMDSLRNLETIEPRAFRALVSLRSLTLESPTGETRDFPIAEVVSATPNLEAMIVKIHKEILDSQFLTLRAPKLRSLEVSGTMRRVSPHAFTALGRQRSLSLRLTNSAVSELPPGLVRPLVRIPHLTLDFTNNHLVNFGPAVLYPNLTGWNRFATKVLPGGLLLEGNPLRCGCSASWVGAWLRRWTSEVGGGTRSARAAARRSACVTSTRAPPRALLELHADEAECHASALSSRSHKLYSADLKYSLVLVFSAVLSLS